MSSITPQDLNTVIQCFFILDEQVWRPKAEKEFGELAIQAKTVNKTWQQVYKQLSQNKLLGLPNDLLLNVFSYLDADATVKVSRTCKALNVLANDETLWEEKANKVFGYAVAVQTKRERSRKAVYKTLAFGRKTGAVQSVLLATRGIQASPSSIYTPTGPVGNLGRLRIQALRNISD